MKIKHISLGTWINEIGVDRAAKLLRVDAATVRNWRRRHCHPRVDQMRLIKKLTKGRVGYDQIIDSPRGGIL